MKATEVIKERLNVTHLRLWTVDGYGRMQYNERQEIGYAIFF